MLNNLIHMHLKLLEKEQLKKKAETTGDLIGNKIADRITHNVLGTSMQIRNTTKIPKEIRIPPEKKQQIIDELRLKYYITRMEYQKIINLLDNETT